MDVELLAVPWDAGQRDVRLGAGPGRLLAAGPATGLGRAGHTVQFTTPGGLGVDDVSAMIVAVGAALPIAGVTLSAYDPGFDSDGRVAAAAIGLACAAVAAAGAAPLSSR